MGVTHVGSECIDVTHVGSECLGVTLMTLEIVNFGQYRQDKYSVKLSAILNGYCQIKLFIHVDTQLRLYKILI